MFHNHKDLIHLSSQALDVDVDSLELEEIQKGGSERRFFRLHSTALDESLILLEYAQGREENNYYAPIAQFLEHLGVPAPRLRSQNEPERLVWMEDLGTVDLHDLMAWDWEKRLALYEKAIRGIRFLHTEEACRTALEQGVPMMPGFDEGTYRWERGYFRSHYLGDVRGRKVDDTQWDAVDAELAASAGKLLTLPRVLVHRDFQSQNIMVAGDQLDRVALIDFQGMRPGVAVYDLASLIEDPYARLTVEQRSELMALIEEDYDAESLRRAAVQRLMQALGAYGYLGVILEKAWFLQHVEIAEMRLKELAGELGLDLLAGLMDETISSAAKPG
jgi:aminoglycoside/choline kinase family phosphotransferase